MQWHYKKGDVWIGPISDEEKERLIKLGVLTQDTLISVCHDSADFVPSNSSDNESSSCDLSDSDEKKENGKYYYYGVHSDSEERELELAAIECGLERISDTDAEEDENWRVTDDEEDWDEEEEEDDEEETTWENDDESLETVDEDENIDDDIDEESEVVDDKEEDVLTVTSDEQWLFDPSDLTNAKDSDEKFDELTVMPDSDVEDEDDEFEQEDTSDVDDLSLQDEWDVDSKQAAEMPGLSRRLEDVEKKIEQVSEEFEAFSTDSDSRLDSLEEQTRDSKKDCKTLAADVKTLSVKVEKETYDWSIRLVELTRDQKSIEVGLERIRKNFGILFDDSYDRLDALEKKAKNFDKNCENLVTSVTSLSVKVSTFNADDWRFRFDDQAERVAIVQEKLTGVQRKINGEVEEKNRRLVDLEEKTENYEKASQVIDNKINSLSGDVASCKNLIDGQIAGLLLASTRLEDLEEVVNDLRRLVNTNVQKLCLIEQETESASTTVLIQRDIINGVCDRVDQLETTLQDVKEVQKKFEQNYASYVSFDDLEKKLDAIRTHCDVQGQSVKTISETLSKNDKRIRERVGHLDSQIKDISNNWERERSLRLQELQKQEQRITNIVENFIQFQEEHTELQKFVDSLEKKIDGLTVKMVVAMRHTEEDGDTQTPAETFWERWGGEFITNGKFRAFVLVASIGLIFLIFEILHLFI